MTAQPSQNETGLDQFAHNYIDSALASGSDLLINNAADMLGVEPAKLRAAYERRYKPFPIEALPDALRWYVNEAARAIGCDPSFIALPMLTMLASCVGTTRAALLKHSWREPCILWSAVVASSGTRKTPALSAVLVALRCIEKRAMLAHTAAMAVYEREYADYDRDVTAWRRTGANGELPVKPEPPAATRYIISDVTVEAIAPILLGNPRGLLLIRDELAGWLGDMDRYSNARGGDVTRWLSVWSAEPIIVDRRTSGTIHVPLAAVSITGTIQPEVLRRVLGRDLRENGLAARLLLAMPPRRPGKWTDADISSAAEDTLAGIVERLLTLAHDTDPDGNSQPVDVPLTDEGSKLFVDWHDKHEAVLSDEEGDLAAALAKLRGYCARLALTIQLARWAAGETVADAIDAQSMASAITLVKWFANEARRIYTALDESDDAVNRRRLVDWIEAREGRVTVRDMTRNLRRYKSNSKAAADALNDLTRAGLGYWTDLPPGERGGRPTAVFVLISPRNDVPVHLADSADADETPRADSADRGFGGAAVLAQHQLTWADGSPVPMRPPLGLSLTDLEGVPDGEG